MPEEVAPAAHEIVREVEQFYYREADLLDGRQFTSWLSLLTHDCVYRIPARSVPQPDSRARGTERFHEPAEEFSDFGPRGSPWRDENLFHLALRADRALKANAWAENPPARTRRFIANVQVRVCGESLLARSNFLLFYNRQDAQQYQYSGQRRDRIVRDGGELKIAEREVLLDSVLIAAPGLGLFF